MEHEDIKSRIHHYLISKTNFLKVKDTMKDDQLRVFVDSAIIELCKETKMEMTFDERATIIRELVSAVVSLGPIRPLIEDPTITEIMINGPKQVYIQRNGRIELCPVQFRSIDDLMHTVQKILASATYSRRVDESSPYVDFSLPDGSRVNILLPPCAMIGPVITIRKYLKELTGLEDLMQKKTLNKQMADFLVSAIKGKLNVVFCGATGCGKTTLLNVLSAHIPNHERIITIEDTAELRLRQQHVVSLQSKPANIEGKGAVTIRDLFINSLRMRPDRIIVGEVRGDEILDMVQSISSGHSGSLAIVHADSPEEAFNRMITMMLMSGIRLTGEQIQEQLASAIDIIVYAELYVDGVRRVTNITDLVSMKDGNGKIQMNDIFTFKQEKIDDNGKVHGDWVLNRKKPSFYKKFVKYNIPLPAGMFD
ncbi:MAG: CpaF family protein [Candidatus Omnitrophica bacterium]|nr:CpaF family protein [Candidatus Omnitrophota bacterium]